MARRVVVYGKPGCHLCDDVRETLAEAAAALDLVVTTVDITTDPGLWARYRYDIPVVTCEDREVGRGRIAEAELLAALRRPAGRSG